MALKNAFGQLALEHASGAGDSHLVSGTKQRWRREFTDPSLAAWDVVTGAGMALSVASSNLTITTGTTANSVTTLTSKDMFNAPFKATIGFRISQKIANQEFFFELVACDKNTGVVDETVVAAWRVAGSDSTTTTIARTEVRNGQVARSQTGNLTTTTQTSDSLFEIVLESDEVSFHNRGVNSTVSKTVTNIWNTVAPDPTRMFKVRIRVVNGATAPASTTSFIASFVTALDYTEILTEITGAQGRSDAGSAMPVMGAGGTLGASQSGGNVGLLWNVAGPAGRQVQDIASAAITASATSAAITPGIMANIGVFAQSFHINVSAASGTSPTLDVGIEESADGGANWVRVYDFQRITASGNYYSPLLRLTWGSRFRYVRTVGGTTPSFTMSLNRLEHNQQGELQKQFFDRAINSNALSSSTPVWNVDGCYKFMLVGQSGAGATTAPVFQMQGSEDGVNWYGFGPALTLNASSTASVTHQDVMPKFVRVVTTTAGVGATLNYLTLKAMNA